MSDTLILIHIGYIVALVWFVWKSGYTAGRKHLCEELLDAKLVSSKALINHYNCLLYTSPSPRDKRQSRIPSCA